MAAWIGGRAAIWENPFATLGSAFPALLAEAEVPSLGSSPDGLAPAPSPTSEAPETPINNNTTFVRFAALASLSLQKTQSVGGASISGSYPFAMSPQIALGHQSLLHSALGYYPGGARPDRRIGATPWQPPLAAPKLTPNRVSGLGRWSLDTWAFWRQGSNASAISQGRTPIYGASQIGANLQFRIAPSSRHDPRLYARSYRALVSGGQTEIAAGLSARPFARMPLRAHGEVRLTENQFETEIRPAAFVVTELAPQRLPAGIVAEAYGQGGWVGGKNATAFADGQLAVTRELARFDLAQGKPARFSIGAGAWGGAQKDAARIDLGPTMRVDLTIGKVPARLSVDWREQVAGDAAPDSGVAATLSTRF